MKEKQKKQKDYIQILAERLEEYKAHMLTMTFSAPFREWAVVMRARYGDRVKVHHGFYTSWLMALMIVRYGEAVHSDLLPGGKWPTELSDADLKRALIWQDGNRPTGVSHVGGASSFKGALLGIGALIAGAVGVWAWQQGFMTGETLLSLSFVLPFVFASAWTNYMEGQVVTHLHRTGKTTVAVWPSDTVVAIGDIHRPTTWNDRLFEVVARAGDFKTGVSEPTWDLDIGDETVDDQITWIAMAVGLPKRAHFIALFTAAPGEAGGGTEVTGGSYARVRLTPLDANWTDVSAGDGQTDNAVDITFPAPTADWGTVSHMSIMDRLTGGNMMSFSVLAASQVINSGQQAPKFAVGALTVTYA